MHHFDDFLCVVAMVVARRAGIRAHGDGDAHVMSEFDGTYMLLVVVDQPCPLVGRHRVADVRLTHHGGRDTQRRYQVGASCRHQREDVRVGERAVLDGRGAGDHRVADSLLGVGMGGDMR